MQHRIKSRYNSSVKKIVVKHVSENINIYLKVFIMFVIGICIGIIVVNQLTETSRQDINDYITNSINKIKNHNPISKLQILKSSIYRNIVIVSLIWFLSLSFLGNIMLYVFTVIIGIALGYTLAAIMASLTFIQGILFFLTGMLLHNIINIPSIMFLIVQGLKIRITKQSNSLKYIIAKYSAFSTIVMISLVIASLIEAYICSELISLVIKYL